MTNKEALHIIIAIVTTVATCVALAVAWNSYEEQKRDNRLDELAAFVTMEDEQRELYLKNRNRE